VTTFVLVLSIWIGVSLLLAVLHGLLGLDDIDDGPGLAAVIGWPLYLVVGLAVAPFYLASWLGKKIREAASRERRGPK
jgi:hypothetical protein